MFQQSVSYEEKYLPQTHTKNFPITYEVTSLIVHLLYYIIVC